MAADIIKMKGSDGKVQYPVTSSEAVGMSDGSGNLDKTLAELDNQYLFKSNNNRSIALLNAGYFDAVLDALFSIENFDDNQIYGLYLEGLISKDEPPYTISLLSLKDEVKTIFNLKSNDSGDILTFLSDDGYSFVIIDKNKINKEGNFSISETSGCDLNKRLFVNQLSKKVIQNSKFSEANNQCLNSLSFELSQNGYNLFNRNNIIKDKYLTTGGGIGSVSGYYISNFIPIKPNTQYTLTPACVGAGAGYCIYDKFLNVISSSGVFNSDKTITTEEAASYIRISGQIRLIDEAIIQEGDSIDTKKSETLISTILSYSLQANEGLKKLDGIAKGDFIQNNYDNSYFSQSGFLGHNGIVTSNKDFTVTDYISVDTSNLFSITANAVFANQYGGGISFYDSAKQFLKSIYEIAVAGYPGVAEVVINISDIPKDTKYIRVCGASSRSDCYVLITTFSLESGMLVSIKKEIQDANQEIDDIKSSLGQNLTNAIPNIFYAKKDTPSVIYPSNAISIKDNNGMYNFIVKEFNNYDNISVGNFTSDKTSSLTAFYLDKIIKIKDALQIKVIDVSTLLGKEAKVLCVGDSYTDMAIWVNEIYEQLSKDGLTVEMIGTQKEEDRRCEGLSGGLITWLLNKNGSGFFMHVTKAIKIPLVGYGKPNVVDANEKEWQVRGVKLTGSEDNYSGYIMIANFNEDYQGDFPLSGSLSYDGSTIEYDSAIPCGFNPFWDNESESINIQKYLQKWGLNEPNLICIQFGMNDLTWGGTVEQALENAKQLISIFHGQLPNAKIIYSVPPYGSYQNPLITTETSQGNTYRNKINFIDFYNKLYDFYKNDSYIKIVPSFLYVDRLNGYNYKEIVPNSRYESVKIKTPIDNIHCNETGMRQISDGVIPYIYGLLVE